MNETGTARFGGVSPYLCYEAALGWLARAFGEPERVRCLDPYGVVRAAEMYAGDTLPRRARVDFWQHLSDEVDLPDGWREVRL